MSLRNMLLSMIIMVSSIPLIIVLEGTIDGKAVAAEDVTAVVVIDTKEQVRAKELEKLAIISFEDVPSSYWGYDAIMEAVQKGYVNGYADGNFQPEKAVTNAEFMKMLTVGLGTSVIPVSGNNWYKPYLDASLNKGYLNHADISGVTWTAQMTRTDVVNMSLAFLGKKPANLKKSWYEATKLGLINGVDTKGTLWENHILTRAQAVTIIERAIKVKNGETLPVDKNAQSVAEVLYHRTNLFTMFPKHLKESDVDKIQEHMFFQTYGGGAYKGETTGVYIIDLSNPNDPYRHLLQGAEMRGMPFTQTTGYVVLSKGIGTVTSNPLNLPNFRPGGAGVSLGQDAPSVYYPSILNVIPLAQVKKTSGQADAIGGAYYTSQQIQNLKLIEFSVTDTIDFGGKNTTYFQKLF